MADHVPVRPRRSRARAWTQIAGNPHHPDLISRVEWLLAVVFTHRLWALDIEIHHDWILPASHHHCLAGHICAGIDFLMWNVRRNVNEISGAGLLAKLQSLAPTHARSAANDVEYSLQVAVVVRASFCMRLDDDSTCPQLACSRVRLSDRSHPRHPRSFRFAGNSSRTQILLRKLQRRITKTHRRLYLAALDGGL